MGKKTKISAETVKKVAGLSRLELSEKELKLYEKQLADILDYIDKLSEPDTSKTLPTSHPLDNLKNVFRKDVVRKSLKATEALKNAPNEKDGFFCVPKIID